LGGRIQVFQAKIGLIRSDPGMKSYFTGNLCTEVGDFKNRQLPGIKSEMHSERRPNSHRASKGRTAPGIVKPFKTLAHAARNRTARAKGARSRTSLFRKKNAW